MLFNILYVAFTQRLKVFFTVKDKYTKDEEKYD